MSSIVGCIKGSWRFPNPTPNLSHRPRLFQILVLAHCIALMVFSAETAECDQMVYSYGEGAFEGSSRGHYYCHQIRGEITPGFATVWTSQKFICRLASLTPSPCLSCSWYWAMLSHKKILYSPSQKIFSDESVRSKSWLFWWYRARVVPVKADSKRSLLCSPR